MAPARVKPISSSDERDSAVTAQHESTSEKLAAYAMESLAHDPERSIILGMHAVNATHQFQKAVLPAAATALHFALASSHTRLTLRGHRGAVIAVAASTDQKFFATASSDSTVKVWDAATGSELRTLQHPDELQGLAVSPDSTRIATACMDGTARLWNLATGQELLTLRGQRFSVNRVAFSPDGRRLATAGSDGTAASHSPTHHRGVPEVLSKRRLSRVAVNCNAAG